MDKNSSTMPYTEGETPKLPQVIPEAEDHWAEITDPKERRKIQNRLAQRAYRVRNSRKGNLRIKFFRPGAGYEHPAGETPTRKRIFPGTPLTVSPLSRIDDPSQTTAARIDKARAIPTEGDSSTSIGNRTSELVVENEESYLDLFRHPVVVEVFVGGVPTDHEFINLLYYNVFRAFQVNIGSLGLTIYLLSLDILSPFNTTALGGSVSEDLEDSALIPTPAPDLISSLPLSLRPTELQISVLHHPWIDLFPCPKLRDNLLRKGDALDGLAICHDVCKGGENENTGLIVWGDPWDVSGWEITEPLAKKWPWMIEGCDEVIEGTNYWRALRGLEKLDLST